MNKQIRNAAPSNEQITRGALPGSRKIYVERRAVPRSARCRAANRRCGCTTPPVRIRTTRRRSTSRRACLPLRRDWILARGDVEEYDGRDRDAGR